MSKQRFLTFVLLLVGLVAAPALPAGAETKSFTDPTGDVVSFEDGEEVHEPTADIEQITARNEASLIEVVVEVAEAVALTSSGWRSEMGLLVVLPPDANADGLGSSLMLMASDTGAQAVATSGCEVTASADLDSDAYTLRMSGPCVRGMPREFKPGAVMMGADWAIDFAPEDIESSPTVSSGVRPFVQRLAGSDRTATAVALSRDRRRPDDAGAAVLVSDASFPDSIAGAPLAAAADGPLLLTGAAALEPRSRDELRRVLQPGGTVYVLGGSAVLSDQILDELRDEGYVPQRVAGTNRFETAVAVANEYNEVLAARGDADSQFGFGAPLFVFIADGRSFTDGVIASAAAASGGAVVLLTDGNVMPAATKEYLDANDSWYYAIGINAAAAAPEADPITGNNPGQLSRHVAERVAPPSGIVAVATEASFADALAGGAHVGSLGGPLLLTNGTALSPDVREVIEEAASGLREVVVYGGTAAVSQAVMQEIEDALR